MRKMIKRIYYKAKMEAILKESNRQDMGTDNICGEKVARESCPSLILIFF